MGQTREVLWEKEVRHGSGIYSGLTDNYIRTYARSSSDIANTISKVSLTGHAGNSGHSLISSPKRHTHGGLWGDLLA